MAIFLVGAHRPKTDYDAASFEAVFLMDPHQAQQNAQAVGV